MTATEARKSGAAFTGVRLSSLRGYALAILYVGAGLALTLAVQHLFAHPFLFLFFAAVIFSAWMGGTGPGLLAVFLSTVAVDYFFIPPLHSLAVKASDAAYVAAFVLSALAGSWVSTSQRESRAALRAAHDQLEIHVAERTAELRRANEDLRERDRQLRLIEHLSRVLTIGELTASIAHEVNQPIAAVVTYAHACIEWLTREPPNLDEARHAAQRIVDDGSRAGAVISRIQSLIKKEPFKREPLDMNGLVREFAVFLKDETEHDHIELRTELDPNLSPVAGDRVQLQQVLQNLAMNGIDAIRASSARPKRLCITTRQDNAAEVVVSVSDSGVGLSPEISEKIFQPFFTTKPQGIGMGLSISRSIVESHGGRFTASPNEGGGAIFKFTLPAASPGAHG